MIDTLWKPAALLVAFIGLMILIRILFALWVLAPGVGFTKYETKEVASPRVPKDIVDKLTVTARWNGDEVDSEITENFIYISIQGGPCWLTILQLSSSVYRFERYVEDGVPKQRCARFARYAVL